MSIIKVNAIQHTSANDTNMTLFANGNVTMTTANTVLRVGNTTISNAGVSVGGVGISQYSGMMKNRIINGDFRIDQRFAGNANNNIAGSQYTVDRWYTYTGAGGATKLRYQQNNTNGPGSSATQVATGFVNYFGANVVSSNTVNSPDAWLFGQGIEGLNIADLGWGTANASPVTLSFWSYSSIAGSHGAKIQNNAGDRSYPFTFTINTANTWQYQTITIPGDTTGSWFSNNNVGMWVFYNLGLGSSFNGTNNTWQSGNYYASGVVQVVNNANGSFYLTGVQLEKGSQATAFDFRHFTTELQLCQRYYQKTYEIGTIPGSATSTSYFVGATLMQSSTGSWGAMHRFPVEMRATPTNTPYKTDGTAGSLDYFTSGTGASSGIVTAFGASTKAIGYYHNGTASGTSGNAVVISGHIVSSAELGVQN